MFGGIIKYLHKGNKDIVISYKSLRRLIGFLGILLPLICITFGWFFGSYKVQPSISLYYYTNVRDFFVGILFVMSLFLMTYKGSYRIDNWITSITGIAGLMIAVFPCYNSEFDKIPVGLFQLYSETSNYFHQTSAATFFLLLAINSIFLFTRKEGVVTKQKIKRNVVYVTCGVIILVCFAALVLSMLIFSFEQRAHSKIILIIEAIALLAFGVSWLVKGQTIIPDKH